MPTTNSIRFDDEPLALPDVIEGSDDGDWELWDDSVIQLEGQIDALAAGGFQVDENRDPFAGVGRRRDF